MINDTKPFGKILTPLRVWRAWRRKVAAHERAAALSLLQEEAEREVRLTDYTPAGRMPRVCIAVRGVPLTQPLATAAEMLDTLKAQRALYVESRMPEAGAGGEKSGGPPHARTDTPGQNPESA